MKEGKPNFTYWRTNSRSQTTTIRQNQLSQKHPLMQLKTQTAAKRSRVSFNYNSRQISSKNRFSKTSMSLFLPLKNEKYQHQVSRTLQCKMNFLNRKRGTMQLSNLTNNSSRTKVSFYKLSLKEFFFPTHFLNQSGTKAQWHRSMFNDCEQILTNSRWLSL